jgi:N-acetylglucosaminyl-diphospho-decaprenol L-rhamnosyltransferase
VTDLGIVIVTFNSRQEIDGCLESLTAAPPALRHQIVVVDNASRDGTADHVRARWPGVTVIDAGANLGFAAACNVGIRATTGPLVLLLNPDTRVPAGALDRLAARLRAQPDTAAVGPRIVDARGRAELSFGPMIGPVAELRQKALVAGSRAGLPLISALVERMTRRSGKVDWVSGACLMAGRSDLEEVGLLDERYFLYTEDVDLCAALRARGRAVRFVADVEIVHLRGRSAATDRAAAEAVYRRSQLAFYAKHHPGWTPLLRIYLKLRGRLPDTRK